MAPIRSKVQRMCVSVWWCISVCVIGSRIWFCQIFLLLLLRLVKVRYLLFDLL